MSDRSFEAGEIYLNVVPTLNTGEFTTVARQVSDILKKNLSDILGSSVDDSELSEKLENAISKGFEEGSDSVSDNLGGSKVRSALSSAGKNVGKALQSQIVSSLKNSLISIGSSLKKTMSTALSDAARMSSGVIGGSLGAVATTALTSGFQRSMSLQESKAGLSALGYSAKQLDSIISTARESVDGLSYSLTDAVSASKNLLAAGVENDKLGGVLDSLAKATDLASGRRTYDEMSQIFSRMATSTSVMTEDLNMLADAGVSLASLASAMGMTTSEMRDMASQSKITFSMVTDGINSIQYDSKLFANLSPRAAFGNLISSLGRIGEQIWNPIISRSAVILTNVKDSINALAKSPAFERFINTIVKSLDLVMDKIESFSEKLSGIFTDGSQGIFSSLTNQFNNLKNLNAPIGPILGTFAALSSGLLSRIPVLGQFIGSFSLFGGLLSGIIIQITATSASFRESIGNLFTTIGEFVTKLFSVINVNTSKSSNENIGDRLAGIVNSLTEAIERIDIQKLGAQISVFIDQSLIMVQSVGSSLVSILQIAVAVLPAIGNILTTLSPVIATILSILATVVKQVITGISEVITFISGGSIQTSELSNQVGQGLVTAVKFIADNIGAIIIMIGALKLTKFIKKGWGILDLPVQILNGIGKSLSKINIGTLMVGIGKVSAIVGAVALVGVLLDQLGAIDLFQRLISFASGIILDIGSFLTGTVGQFISGIGDYILNQITVISNSISIVVDTIAGAMTSLSDSLAVTIPAISESSIGLISSLKNDGIGAAQGLLALSSALVAFSFALAGSSGASIITSITSLFSTEESPLKALGTLVRDFGIFNNQVMNSPVEWLKNIPAASDAGLKIANSFISGLKSGINAQKAAIQQQVRQLLTPTGGFNLMQPMGFGVGGFGSNYSRYTTNNNYNFTTNNSDVMRRLIRASR